MSEATETDARGGFSISLLIVFLAGLICGVTGYLWYATDNSIAAIVCLMAQTILIWQACDPFAEAAQFIGMEFRLPGSVRGATLDAIASSMPELFTGIFFVVVLTLGGDVSPEAASGGEQSA